mgnify:CR=1 FL=1
MKKILERLPATVLLNALSMLLILVLGITLGVYSALNEGKFIDHFITVFVFAYVLKKIYPNKFDNVILIVDAKKRDWNKPLFTKEARKLKWWCEKSRKIKIDVLFFNEPYYLKEVNGKIFVIYRGRSIGFVNKFE